MGGGGPTSGVEARPLDQNDVDLVLLLVRHSAEAQLRENGEQNQDAKSKGGSRFKKDLKKYKPYTCFST